MAAQIILPRPYQNLSVVQIDRKNSDTVAKTIQLWMRISEEYMAREPSKRTILRDCKEVCQIVEDELLAEDSFDLYECLDQEGKVGGMMILRQSEDEIRICSIVTNPTIFLGWNQSIKGVGTSLIQTAKQLATETDHKTIRVHSLENAIGFYQKMGFRSENGKMKSLIWIGR